MKNLRPADLIKTMKAKLKSGKKTLNSFQQGHLKACIQYVKDLATDFKTARDTYNARVKELYDARR